MTPESNIPAITAKLLEKLVAIAELAVAELEARFQVAIAEGKPLPIRELTQALAALERTLKLHRLLEKDTPAPEHTTPKSAPQTAPPAPNRIAGNIARMVSGAGSTNKAAPPNTQSNPTSHEHHPQTPRGLVHL